MSPSRDVEAGCATYLTLIGTVMRFRRVPVRRYLDLRALNARDSSLQLSQNVCSKELVDFSMSGHRLGTPALGFRYQSCLPPCRIRTHPASSSLRTRSVRFI